MATALERNKELVAKYDAEMEQLQDAGAFEANIPGESGAADTDLTESRFNEPTTPKAGDEPVRDVTYWKQRALTAEGRYNTLKPRLDETIHKLRTEKAELEKTIDALSLELKGLRPDPIRDRLLDPAVQDVLGANTATAIVDSLTDIRNSVEERVRGSKKVDPVIDQIQYDNFVGDVRSSLKALHPSLSLEQVNTSAGFASFLDGKRSPNGTLYRTLFNGAVSGKDVTSVVSFFSEYADLVQEAAPVSPSVEVKDSIQARLSPKTVQRQPDVSSRPSEKISQAFINDFQQKLSKGYYKHRYSERIAIEQKIEAAYLSNNITD